MKTYTTGLPSDDYCKNTEHVNGSLDVADADKLYTTDNQIYCYCKYQT